MSKQDWTYKKLGEACSINYGTRVVQKKDKGSTYYVYGGGGATFMIDRYNREDCFIVSRFAMSPKCTRFVEGKFFLNDSGLSVSTNDEGLLCQKFLDKVLLANNNNIYAMGKGMAQRNLDMPSFRNLIIPVPPIGEQERIVAELDLLQGIIEKKKEQLKAYDQLAQSIFYTMFGDIEEDTPVSEYISALSGGKSLAGETECKNKVLKTGAVTYDYFRGNEVKNLPADYQPIKEHLLNDGDILISRMNTLEYVGACAYVWKAPLNTYLPDRLWRATLKDNINPIFLWFSLIQDKAKEQIRSMASGTSGSMKNISIPRFLTVKIKCIPLSLQEEFAEKVEAIERQKALVQQSIEETQTMFDYTMDKYFG